MSALGQKQTYAAQQVISPYSQLRLQKRIFALRHVRFTPKSGHVSALAYVCFGPKADIGVVAETERPPRGGLSEIRSGAAIGPLNSQ